jgi:hypothetical protein
MDATEIGTSWMFSLRRWAVTITSPRADVSWAKPMEAAAPWQWRQQDKRYAFLKLPL